MKYLHLFLILGMSVCSMTCSSFVNDVDEPQNLLDDQTLNDESRFQFLMNGVRHRFATVFGQTALFADILSDALDFEESLAPDGSIRLDEIDIGQIRIDGEPITELFRSLSELRFMADDLVARAENFRFADGALRQEVLYNGNLYGGIARYLYGTYFGITEKNGGGVIDGGPFIASREMYELAIERLDAAGANAATDGQRRLCSSVKAKIYLVDGDATKAQTSALAGLQIGDDAFQARFGGDGVNPYWSEAGRGSAIVVNIRLVTATPADPRILVEPDTTGAGATLWRQIVYPESNSPLEFVSWQENELILAETLFSSGNSSDALTHLNAVRESYGLARQDTLDSQTLAGERERTLFMRGLRLVDQRRFGTFHLPAGTWQYLPIPEEERVINPNIN